ncbi:MAG: ATP-grasp domain-containing protein [Candidatus Hodarchaeota archaeon]
MPVQEYLDTNDWEYTTGLLVDKNLNVPTICTFRRELGRLGASHIIESGDYEEIDKLAKKVAKELGSPEPINVQFIRTEEGVKVLEINPRFSSTTVFRAMLGVNEVHLMTQHLLNGTEIEPKKPEKGFVGLRYYEERIFQANKLIRKKSAKKPKTPKKKTPSESFELE